MNTIRPIKDIRVGDPVFLGGRRVSPVEQIERSDGRFTLVLTDGTRLGPMTEAYSIELAVTEPQYLAEAIVREADAVANGADAEGLILAENDVLALLDVPLDQTELGMTKEATERVERFVSETLGRAWTYAGWAS